MDSRETRLARNETLFREVNERIEQAVEHTSREDGHIYEFLCECSNSDCMLLLPLTIVEYEAVRSDPRQFIVAPGHELPEIEKIIALHRGYQVVQKSGDAAEFVAERDPRS
jgi:hypothetical protein